jgi:phosphatidylserine/phosphatidylglycerophosphate/cardiolipin synthase-like enzyme
MAGKYYAVGTNAAAPFSLKLHRGDGMTLLGMSWKAGTPPDDFVGFAIEYMEPNGDRFYSLKNRLSFPTTAGDTNPNRLSTRLSPIQKFRWVHFPRYADLPGEFLYRVTPVYMNTLDELSYGEPQEAGIELRRETCPGQLNVAFTRGYMSSQAFVDRYLSAGPISKLLPRKAQQGLTFVPTHPKAQDAYQWMGFEARLVLLELLDEAIADATASVHVVAYDLCEPEVVRRLEQLGARLRIIIDDDGDHGLPTSAESQAESRLQGCGCQVKRQHMGKLQHNKTIVVDGPNLKKAACGSTNLSWRGLYVQANNVLQVQGASAVQPFLDAFNQYWTKDTAGDFGATDPAANWTSLGFTDIDASVTFSPHTASNARLQAIADDIRLHTSSCLFYSLAFLYQTSGSLVEAIKEVSKNNQLFVYGISDRKVGGLYLQKPDTNVSPVYASALEENVPEPFKSEPVGGGGTRMHHKFVVIDFDKPTARVYLGSYNFSSAADIQNGENLLLIRDRRIATSYMIEALRIFDHYHFRVNQYDADRKKEKLQLAKPPRQVGEVAWWLEDYTDPHKSRDRELFS